MREWMVEWAAALWIATLVSILVLSLLPASGTESDVGSSWIWNCGHVPAYAAFAAFAALAVSKRTPLGGHARLCIGGVAVLLAITMELLQPVVGRTASVADAAYGGLGVLFGLWMQRRLEQGAGPGFPKGAPR